MYLSMGNITANDKVRMQFIDFETPHRIRVHGKASINSDDPLLPEFPGAELIVRITVTEIFVNCPRDIHTDHRIASSKYVPKCDQPTLAPQWKRIDIVQDALPERDLSAADSLGGIITLEQYGKLVVKGAG